MRGKGRFLIGLTLGLIGWNGCSSPAPKSCIYAGAEDAGISGILIARSPDGGAFGPVEDGGTILISGAPQGGYVIYAGAFATNLDPCGVTLSGELLIADGGAALTNLDERQSDFSVLESSLDYGPSDLFSALPNIPVCDSGGPGVLAGPSILQITITDANGKSAVLQSLVQAACAANDDFCAQSCAPQ